jgi:hypothetical protein
MAAAEAKELTLSAMGGINYKADETVIRSG